MGGAHSASGAGRGEIRVSAVRIRTARRRGQAGWPRRAIPMQLSRVPMDADILRCLHLDGPGLPRTPDPRPTPSLGLGWPAIGWPPQVKAREAVVSNAQDETEWDSDCPKVFA